MMSVAAAAAVLLLLSTAGLIIGVVVGCKRGLRTPTKRMESLLLLLLRRLAPNLHIGQPVPALLLHLQPASPLQRLSLAAQQHGLAEVIRRRPGAPPRVRTMILDRRITARTLNSTKMGTRRRERLVRFIKRVSKGQALKVG